MLYPEFNQYQPSEGVYKGFINAYVSNSGYVFYADSAFHDLLKIYEIKAAEEYPKLLERIYQIIEEKPVFLTGDFEAIPEYLDGYTYVDLDDVANRLGILLRNDNRPTDYGD